MSAAIGRLAPSPTGRLHLGHARSLLAAWWSARSLSGQVCLRLEDLDATRVRPEYVQGILDDLRWLGIDWDGEPVAQAALTAGHAAALETLRAKGLAYPCVCTRKDIQRAIAAPHRGESGTLYPGTCRDRFVDGEAAWRATGREPAWRFCSQGMGTLRFSDGLSGEHTAQLEQEVGDFVIWTKAGCAAYQLAVVVDDAASGVNQVVRGDDLIPSTFQQLALQAALGYARPRWWHLGLVVDAQGRRLAKREGSHSLSALRDAGVAPDAVVRWVAQSVGMDPTGAATPPGNSGARLADFYREHFSWSRVTAEAVCSPSEWTQGSRT